MAEVKLDPRKTCNHLVAANGDPNAEKILN